MSEEIGWGHTGACEPDCTCSLATAIRKPSSYVSQISALKQQLKEQTERAHSLEELLMLNGKQVSEYETWNTDLGEQNARLREALEKISCANKCVNSEFTAAYMRSVADVALEPFKEVIHGIQSRQDKITKIPGSAECDHRWENVQAVDVVCETCGVSQRTLTGQEPIDPFHGRAIANDHGLTTFQGNYRQLSTAEVSSQASGPVESRHEADSGAEGAEKLPEGTGTAEVKTREPVPSALTHSDLGRSPDRVLDDGTVIAGERIIDVHRIPTARTESDPFPDIKTKSDLFKGVTKHSESRCKHGHEPGDCLECHPSQSEPDCVHAIVTGSGSCPECSRKEKAE